MEEVTIRFADGTELEAEQNGSCFIANEKPVFPADLSEVTVEGDTVSLFSNAQVVECASVDGRYWFTFREVTADEHLRADVDYLLLMQE